MKELTKVKTELAELKQKHTKLKKYHKEKRKVQTTTSTISLHHHRKIQRKLESEKEDLELQIQEAKLDDSDPSVQSKKDGKTFSSTYRKCIYNCILNQVPVEATGQLIKDIVEDMTGKTLSAYANTSTVSQCAYELGILGDS